MGLILYIFLIAIPCGFVCARMQEKKGYGSTAGFLLGLIFGPLGVAFIFAAEPNWDAVRRCARCRGINPMHRVHCRECGGDLDEDPCKPGQNALS